MKAQDAQELLELGLNRFESQNNFSLTEDILDKCWDISLFVKIQTKIMKNVLGRYYSPETRNGIKFNGEAHIHIYNHTKACGTYGDYEDTVLHELAHHIAYCLYGHTIAAHGTEWKEICVLIGARPQSTQRAV